MREKAPSKRCELNKIGAKTKGSYEIQARREQNSVCCLYFIIYMLLWLLFFSVGIKSSSLFSKTPESEMEVETKSYFKHAVEWARERLKTFGISEPCGSGPSVQNYCHDDVHCQKNCDMLLLDHSREALPLDISSKSNNVKVTHNFSM